MDIQHNADGINEPVTRTVLSIAILHPSDMDPSEMTHAEMAGYTEMGQLVARTSVESSTEIGDEAVDAELVALGAQPGHFARPEPNNNRRTGGAASQASSAE